jgi:hypothetical protein
MKILSIGNFGNSWDNSVCDEENIADALEIKGHEVERLQRDNVQDYDWDSTSHDFTLIAQWGNYGEMVVKIKESGKHGPTVYWAFDHQWHAKENWHMFLVENCDVFLTKDHVHEYREINPNTYWLPQDFAPSFLNANFDDNRPEKTIPVLFTGTYLPDATVRTELLKAVDKHFDLHIYSITDQAWIDQGFKNVHPAVVDEGLMDLIPRARVNLSIDIFQAEGFWSDRNAQIMACGGVVLFKHVPMSELIFRDAIQYFHTEEQMLSKIAWLLEQPLWMVEMYAWTFARNNLMVGHRVDDLLVILEGFID